MSSRGQSSRGTPVLLAAEIFMLSSPFGKGYCQRVRRLLTGVPLSAVQSGKMSYFAVFELLPKLLVVFKRSTAKIRAKTSFHCPASSISFLYFITLRNLMSFQFLLGESCLWQLYAAAPYSKVSSAWACYPALHMPPHMLCLFPDI